jgi:hypothetical protein
LLRFFLMTALLVLLILAFLVAGSRMGWFGLPSFSNEIIAFFWLSNVALYWYVTRRTDKVSGDWLRIYLVATVLRIFFFGGFIFGIMFLDRLEAGKNTLFFLVCYFLFTALEIGALFNRINAQNPLKKGQKKP